jgi:acyl-CoA thioester hydrolase
MSEHAVARHSFGCRVYYEDTDAAGIVYYANYLRFAERARTEMLRAAGLKQSLLARETGIAFAVKRCTIEYVKPAVLDDWLDIETQIKTVHGASMDGTQTIRRGDDVLVTLDVTLVALNREGRPVRLPAELRNALGLPARRAELLKL